MEGIAIRLDRFIDRLGRVTAWAAFALALTMAGNVLLRYVFHSGSVWSQELEWHWMAVICTLSISYTILHDGIVRVDVLYANFSPGLKRTIDLMTMAMLMAVAAGIIWLSLPYVANSWNIGETSTNPGGIPYRYALKALIPIGFFLVFLQGLSQFLKLLAPDWSAKHYAEEPINAGE